MFQINNCNQLINILLSLSLWLHNLSLLYYFYLCACLFWSFTHNIITFFSLYLQVVPDKKPQGNSIDRSKTHHHLHVQTWLVACPLPQALSFPLWLQFSVSTSTLIPHPFVHVFAGTTSSITILSQPLWHFTWPKYCNFGVIMLFMSQVSLIFRSRNLSAFFSFLQRFYHLQLWDTEANTRPHHHSRDCHLHPWDTQVNTRAHTIISQDIIRHRM